MDIRATSQYVRISPRKLRLVANAVKPLSVSGAVAQLTAMEKRGAYHLGKTLKSCIANATQNAKAKEEDLIIKSILIDEGPAFKRWHPVSRGMAHGYKKRTSHITVILSTRSEVPVKIQEEKHEKKVEDKKEAKKKTAPKITSSGRKTTVKKGVIHGTKSKS
jgi:large subunit ribosomal protein L22